MATPGLKAVRGLAGHGRSLSVFSPLIISKFPEYSGSHQVIFSGIVVCGVSERLSLQECCRENRQIMLDATWEALRDFYPKSDTPTPSNPVSFHN